MKTWIWLGLFILAGAVVWPRLRVAEGQCSKGRRKVARTFATRPMRRHHHWKGRHGPAPWKPLDALLCSLHWILLCAVVSCAGGESTNSAVDEPAAESRVETTRPAPVEIAVDNAILITVDTLRYDALGFTGNTKVSTPVLDRLAAGGWVFDRAYAHNVVTLPSHVNILTGLLPYQHGVRDNTGFTLAESFPTAGSWLTDLGFATAAFVAAFPLDRSYGLARGFELYDDRYPKGSNRLDVIAERPGDEVVQGAVEWWRSQVGRRRFLWVHLYDPHAPYEPPQPAVDPYLGEVSAVDRFLEPLLGPILAGEESVVVAITSDHGEALGDHGEKTHGVFAYEATLHVPLVLWAPGLEPARRTELVSHVDLLPTLLDALQVELPQPLSGRSLFAGEAARPVYFESLTPTLDRGWAPLRGIIDGDHKLIELPLPELYDLARDPAESDNLVDRERQLARRLASALPVESRWPPGRDPAAGGDEEELRALGYLGGSAPAKERYTVTDDPKNLVHLDRKMHQAIDHFHRGRLDEAERLTREVLAERDDLGAAYYYLSQVLLARERVREAIAVMQQARRRQAASPALERQLGLSLSEVGLFAEARAVLEPLAADGDPRTLNALGVVLSEVGDQSAAEAILTRLVADDPENPEAWQNLGLVALRNGDSRLAQERARRATALNPELSLAWSYDGAASYQLGRRREALTAFQRAVELDPANYDALFNITLVAGELGETASLRRALEQFVATAPPSRYGPDIEAARRRLRELSR